MPANTYDAIVMGSGTSGGWAAKDLPKKVVKQLGQNPSLTYMAMTARAADQAVSALKKGEL